MKTKILFSFVFVVILLSSCIKDEGPLNKEADIDSFRFEDIETIPYINQEFNTITAELENTDVSRLIPVIEVSEGATVYPPSGLFQNFSNPVKYTVTSEDGAWIKEYIVTIETSIPPQPIVKYDFEDWGEAGGLFKYPAINDALWTSANSGIAIAKVGNVDYYPTRPTTDAYDGEFAAMLETQKGGRYWGNLIPIFSGSLFRGKFNINMQEFAKSAKFGQPHPQKNGKPILFKGYYKYKPGEEYIDENDRVVAGKTDEFSIYAILYKVTRGEPGLEEYLDGTNIMTSDKVIARAEVTDRTAKESFTEFSVSFIYTEQPDYDRYDYKLAVVFASSRDGDQYRGAPGSTLIVDKAELHFELPE